MVRFGYTLMTEQSGPKQLVEYAVSAERVGFDFEVCSDHFSPWLTSQGHAPNAWTTLGAVAHATDRVELFTYVTCPTMRYHPAIVAQQAATLQLLADGRFTLGLGSGENLNEHVVGAGWPTVDRRQAMLAEAIEVIRELHTGELVNWKGEYFEVDSARIWDLPEVPVPIGVAVSDPDRRLATGVEYAVGATRRADRPVFVTGGVTASTIGSLVHEGLRHFVVVRALTLAPDPESSARELRRALDDALSTVTIEPT